jgi:uncharacterized protein YjlB
MMKYKGIFSIFFISIFFSMNAQVNINAQITAFPFEENGLFPNNPRLPVLLYKNIFEFNDLNPASVVEKVFSQNNWGGSWRNGIYNYHHYHSTAHEALGVYAGWADVQLGGPENKPVRIEKGDLVILPAGTAHKRIDSGGGFAVVGAYPDNQDWDMNYGKEDEAVKAKQNIEKVALPKYDPVLGEKGKLFTFWK